MPAIERANRCRAEVDRHAAARIARQSHVST